MECCCLYGGVPGYVGWCTCYRPKCVFQLQYGSHPVSRCGNVQGMVAWFKLHGEVFCSMVVYWWFGAVCRVHGAWCMVVRWYGGMVDHHWWYGAWCAANDYLPIAQFEVVIGLHPTILLVTWYWWRSWWWWIQAFYPGSSIIPRPTLLSGSEWLPWKLCNATF